LKTPKCALDPATGKVDKTNGWKNCREKAWRGLEKAVTDGLVRFIGVSNFHHEKHLMPLLTMPGRKYPVYANQIEYHPFVPQYWVDTKNFCEKTGIRVIGYGSMGGLLKDGFKEHFHVKRAMTHFNKTMEELFLTYSLNDNVAVIPGTVKRKHLDMALRLEKNYKKILGITIPSDERIKCYQPDAYEYE